MSRRKFLARSAGAAGLFSIGALSCASGGGDEVRVRIVYALHTPVQDRPDWPNVGFEFTPVMERVDSELSKRCEGFSFLSSTASSVEEAERILEADRSADIDGYLVYQMNCWNEPVKAIAESGKPVLYADLQYAGSGGFLVYNASFLRNYASNVGFVASSRIEDLAKAVLCFRSVKQNGDPLGFAEATRRVRIASTPVAGDLDFTPDKPDLVSPEECLRRMKESRILALKDADSGLADSIMEIPVEKISLDELNAAWESANLEESRAIADRWEETAARIEEVSRETLEDSAGMYLAQKALLKKYGANAIAINCLGGFYGGHIHAYPCLGFHELNNEGLVGACECDLRSTAVMVSFTALTQGRPGYISDPVLDTSKRQIIYAHCVAPNRMFGPEGPTNPFEILTHSEDRQGASVRSLMPLGYMTTTLEIQPDRREILFHQAKAVANDPDDRACRTKLAAEPLGDIEKLFTQWDRWGWHRVTFYGDLKDPTFALADAIGWKVVEEA